MDHIHIDLFAWTTFNSNEQKYHACDLHELRLRLMYINNKSSTHSQKSVENRFLYHSHFFSRFCTNSDCFQIQEIVDLFDWFWKKNTSIFHYITCYIILENTNDVSIPEWNMIALWMCFCWRRETWFNVHWFTAIGSSCIYLSLIVDSFVWVKFIFFSWM